MVMTAITIADMKVLELTRTIRSPAPVASSLPSWLKHTLLMGVVLSLARALCNGGAVRPRSPISQHALRKDRTKFWRQFSYYRSGFPGNLPPPSTCHPQKIEHRGHNYTGKTHHQPGDSCDRGDRTNDVTNFTSDRTRTKLTFSARLTLGLNVANQP